MLGDRPAESELFKPEIVTDRNPPGLVVEVLPVNVYNVLRRDCDIVTVNDRPNAPYQLSSSDLVVDLEIDSCDVVSVGEKETLATTAAVTKMLPLSPVSLLLPLFSVPLLLKSLVGALVYLPQA